VQNYLSKKLDKTFVSLIEVMLLQSQNSQLAQFDDCM
jgi:hypothetical protein